MRSNESRGNAAEAPNCRADRERGQVAVFAGSGKMRAAGHTPEAQANLSSSSTESFLKPIFYLAGIVPAVIAIGVGAGAIAAIMSQIFRKK